MKNVNELLNDEKYVASLQNLVEVVKSYRETFNRYVDECELALLSDEYVADEDDKYLKEATEGSSAMNNASRQVGRLVFDAIGENPDFETAGRVLRCVISYDKLPDQMIDYSFLAKNINKYTKNEYEIIVSERGKIVIYPNLEAVEKKLRAFGYSRIKNENDSANLEYLSDDYVLMVDPQEHANKLVIEAYGEQRKIFKKHGSSSQPGDGQ